MPSYRFLNYKQCFNVVAAQLIGSDGNLACGILPTLECCHFPRPAQNCSLVMKYVQSDTISPLNVGICEFGPPRGVSPPSLPLQKPAGPRRV